VELYLLVFKKLVKANEMSEQTVALKTTVKGKGKTNSLGGLLKAGTTDGTDSKEFLKKLLEMTKKGEIELDKNGSIKLKTTTTQKKETEADETAAMHLKQLFSQIKLNDRIAIEKSVKELRDNTDKTKDPKEMKDLKKLLDLAKNANVDVKKISVEEVKEDPEAKKAAHTQKAKTNDKQPVVEHKPETQKTEVEQPKAKQQPKEIVKEAVVEQPKKENINLVTLLQQSGQKVKDEKETPVITNKEPSNAQKAKDGKKENEQKVAQKPSDGIVAAFKESATTSEAKAEDKKLELLDVLAKKETLKDESINRKEPLQNTTMLEAPKQTDMELKSKMAVAAEGLKNFSEDLKETIDNYKPPLMKVSMEMNPQNLGNVDVTLITRGQNLIVNVSSNQDTMQMFMQNISEFKANLMAQGFVSLQMNFNFSDSNKEQNNKNWQKEAAKKYQVNGDITTKSIESLDIVMPHPKYA